MNCIAAIACLPYSDYTFVMAVSSQKTGDFVYALSSCLEDLGGSPKILIPDNLKAAVTKSDKYEPDMNRIMKNFGNRYGLAVLPACPYRPKDKAAVGGHVKIVYTRVYVKKLLLGLKVTRAEGSIIRLFEKLAKTERLILDDFGLTSLEKQQQLDSMEIIEDRHARKATITASQLPVSSWFDVFSDETLADSVIDRIVYTSHRFELKGESLRKKR
ncbi:MAG: ATP-binding protein [Dysgonamonadaceae bacterium]